MSVNQGGIDFPVPTGVPEWAIWHDTLQEITDRNQVWPRLDGEEIEIESHIWWLRQVEQPRPEHNPLAETLVGSEEIDKPNNELRTLWTVVPLPAEESRDLIQSSLESQIRTFTQVQLAEDDTRRFVTEQDYSRYHNALEELAITADADLPTFDAVLSDYALTEQQYAANLVLQETQTLAFDRELKESGDEGILSESEQLDVQSRITSNGRVARGLEAGVRAPEVGAPRGLATLPGEAVRAALFAESTFEWSGTTYYMPLVRLDDIPDGIELAQLFAMVYDAANIYRSWLPFNQDPEGGYVTPIGPSYASLAKTSSATWRVAIAYQGTSAEYEITQRVVLVPPGTRREMVRWS